MRHSHTHGCNHGNNSNQTGQKRDRNALARERFARQQQSQSRGIALAETEDESIYEEGFEDDSDARWEREQQEQKAAECPHGGVHAAGVKCSLSYEVLPFEFLVWPSQEAVAAGAKAKNFVCMVSREQAVVIGRKLQEGQEAGRFSRYMVRDLGLMYEDQAFERAVEWASWTGFDQTGARTTTTATAKAMAPTTQRVQ